MATRSYTLRITTANETAVDALARVSELPKGRIKDAMTKGAVWLKRGSRTKRIRRSTHPLLPGDELSLHYHPEVLALIPPQAVLCADERQYSVWIKPPGLLAQGSQEGDHCSLLRQVELALKRAVFLVHRLDREASGLMLVAHTANAAASLSALFARQDADTPLRKLYQIEVKGQLPPQGEIVLPVDGKQALSRYRRLAYDARGGNSIAEVELVTGRKHQIRRHFADSGHPVLGDPLYGSNNKDSRGLQLRAVSLEFICPLTKLARHYRC